MKNRKRQKIAMCFRRPIMIISRGDLLGGAHVEETSTAERKRATHFSLAAVPSHSVRKAFRRWSQNFRWPVLVVINTPPFRKYPDTMGLSNRPSEVPDHHPFGNAVDPAIASEPISLLRAAKRVFDIAVATLALVLLSPTFLLVAAAIKIGSRGPVLRPCADSSGAIRRPRAWPVRPASRSSGG